MLIYKITHISSGRFYIGKTKQKLQTRYKQHIKKSCNKILRNLFNKYPIKDFEFETLESLFCITEVGLSILEQEYLDKYFEHKLCINHYKCSWGIDSETATKLGKERGPEWVSQIKEGARVWRKNNPNRSYSNNIKNLEKGRDAHKEWREQNKKANVSQLIKARDNYHATKTKEQEQSRRDKLRASKVVNLVPILMYDLSNNLIGEYESIRSIIRTYPTLHRRGIQKVLKKEYNQHKGYIFIYKQ